jgi:hypothetical protein
MEQSEAVAGIICLFAIRKSVIYMKMVQVVTQESIVILETLEGFQSNALLQVSCVITFLLSILRHQEDHSSSSS